MQLPYLERGIVQWHREGRYWEQGHLVQTLTQLLTSFVTTLASSFPSQGLAFFICKTEKITIPNL